MERFGENGPVVKVGNEADIGTGKNRVMKFMLRDFETGLLYRRPGEWVENHLQATGSRDRKKLRLKEGRLRKQRSKCFASGRTGSRRGDRGFQT